MLFARRSLVNSLQNAKTSFVTRLSSKEWRFRLAVSAGFVIASVGILVLGVGAKLGIADSMWGSMEINVPGKETPRLAATREPSAQYRRSSHRISRDDRDSPRRHARNREDDGERGSARHLSGRDRNDRSAHSYLASYTPNQPVQLARKSVCVRLCDGFVFPVGDYHGDYDKSAHQATCQSMCPGSATALYLLPGGSDAMSEATEVSTGKTYSQMPDAFRYTTYFDETCSCQPAGASRTKSLLRDFTLRRGDSVMTSRGLQVFHGGSGYPFRRRDFVALNKSFDIQPVTRVTLRQIERASLIATSNIASRSTAAKAKAATLEPVKKTVPTAASAPRSIGLQRQALN